MTFRCRYCGRGLPLRDVLARLADNCCDDCMVLDIAFGDLRESVRAGHRSEFGAGVRQTPTLVVLGHAQTEATNIVRRLWWENWGDLV